MENNKKGTLIYHIAPEIRIQNVSKGWKLFNGKEERATVTLLSDNTTLQLSDFTEETQASPYRTWIFEGEMESKGGSILKVDFSLNQEVTTIKVEIDLK